MRAIGLGSLTVVILAALAQSALADDAAATTADPVAFHKGQWGGSVRLGLGVRGIATYENNVYCGDTAPEAEFGYASVCTGRTPFSLDLEGSYGIGRSIELVLELRIGLETDFGPTPGASGPRPFHIAPGARFFFSEAKRTKLFVQPELVFDFGGYNQGNDFAVRGIEGFWVDLHKNYSVYLYVAETLGFSRWLSAAFEGGVGFQGRYP